MRARAGMSIEPCSTASSPMIARNSVVLPMPLRPTSPTRAPSGMRAEAPSSNSRPAMRIEMSSRTSMRAFIAAPRGLASATACSHACWTVLRAMAKEIIMCVPGCREAIQRALSRRGFFRGAAAAARRIRRDRGDARAGAAQLHVGDRPDPLTVAGISDVLRRSRHRRSSKKLRLQEGRLQLNWWKSSSMPARIWMRRSTIRRTGADRREDTGRSTGRAARGRRCRRRKAARNADYAMTKQDIADWEAQNGRLPDGCCVAMNSGWAAARHQCGEIHRQGRSRRVAFSRRPSGRGRMAGQGAPRRRAWRSIRCRSIPGSRRISRPTKLWLPSGRWGIENIANLDKVPATGATLVAGCPRSRTRPAGRRASSRWCKQSLAAQAFFCQRPFSSACQ